MVYLQNIGASFISYLGSLRFMDHTLFLDYSHTRCSRLRLASIIRPFRGSSMTSTLLVPMAAIEPDIVIVFLQSDSGEGYITVDGNAGDR
jgi:hypothetical protein